MSLEYLLSARWMYNPDEGITDISSAFRYYGLFATFMIMGAGANWVFPTALAQEIPYLQVELPEKLCIATYMNATTNLGLASMLAYLYYHTYIKPIPYSYSVPSLLLLSAIGSFFSAAVYNVTIDNASICLYICCAIGGSVGALSSVIMNPFMTAYKNNFITAARAGGSAYILLCALISVAQNPGSTNMRFSVATYMIIFGCLLSPPILAYKYITDNNLGLRDNSHTSPEAGEGELDLDHKEKSESSEISPEVNSKATASFLELGVNPLHTTATEGEGGGRGGSPTQTSLIAGSAGMGDGFHSSSTSTSTSRRSRDDRETYFVVFGCRLYSGIVNDTVNNFMAAVSAALVRDKWHEEMPWLRRTVPYMLTVGWVNFNTWGMVTALLPFAMSNISSGSGSSNLAIAYEVAAVLLVLGDLSTAFFKMRIYIGLTIFTSFCFTIYLASTNMSGFHTPSSPVIVIIIFSIERFIEAHLVTSTYRAIATEFDLKDRQPASRAVGMCDQASTTLGAVISTVLVTALYSCNQPTDD